MSQITPTTPLKSPTPNSNCLEGIACPQCGSTEPFRIVATATFLVIDDGTGDAENIEWADASPITCVRCRHSATVKQFSTPTTMPCRECGEECFISAEGTAHHWVDPEDGSSDATTIDHELDADHTAVPDAGTPAVDPGCQLGADGFCPTHGWACSDFKSYLAAFKREVDHG